MWIKLKLKKKIIKKFVEKVWRSTSINIHGRPFVVVCIYWSFFFLDNALSLDLKYTTYNLSSTQTPYWYTAIISKHPWTYQLEKCIFIVENRYVFSNQFFSNNIVSISGRKDNTSRLSIVLNP